MTNFLSVRETQCGNYRNLLLHFFGKNFVKATFLLKKFRKRPFDEKNYVRVKFSFFHAVMILNMIALKNFAYRDATYGKNMLLQKSCY